MTTTTPHTDNWRDHTRQRMRALDIDAGDVARQTGLPFIVAFDAVTAYGVKLDHETTGPIDELLDKLEAASDAYAIEHGTRKLEAVHAGEAVRVERLAVSLDPLTNHEVKR